MFSKIRPDTAENEPLKSLGFLTYLPRHLNLSRTKNRKMEGDSKTTVDEAQDTAIKSLPGEANELQQKFTEYEEKFKTVEQQAGDVKKLIHTTIPGSLTDFNKKIKKVEKNFKGAIVDALGEWTTGNNQAVKKLKVQNDANVKGMTAAKGNFRKALVTQEKQINSTRDKLIPLFESLFKPGTGKTAEFTNKIETKFNVSRDTLAQVLTVLRHTITASLVAQEETGIAKIDQLGRQSND